MRQFNPHLPVPSLMNMCSATVKLLQASKSGGVNSLASRRETAILVNRWPLQHSNLHPAFPTATAELHWHVVEPGNPKILPILERFSIRWNRISAPAFWFGRIFCAEPVSTSSENASFLFGRIFFDEPASTSSENASFLFGRIFCDEPASTSSENALVSCLVAFSATNRYPRRRKML